MASNNSCVISFLFTQPLNVDLNLWNSSLTISAGRTQSFSPSTTSRFAKARYIARPLDDDDNNNNNNNNNNKHVMRTGIFALVAVSLLQLAASQPGGRSAPLIGARDILANMSMIGHRHRHQARQVVVTNIDYVTEYDIVTKTVYGGQPSSVAVPSSSSLAQAPVAPSSAASQPPTYSAASQPPAYSAASQPPAPSAASAASSTAAPSSPAAPSDSPGPGAPGPSSQMGITYTPKNADGSCKLQDQVNTDFEKINGYGVVRIYETNCNQVSTVLSAAKSKNMKLFAGILDINQVSSGIQTIIDAAKDDWGYIDTVAIGNELVNSGGPSVVGAVVGAIGTARGLLRSAGYTGPVVTVDTVEALIANPQLCAASDYCAANCHAFYNGYVEASNAGEFVSNQTKRLSKAAGKHTVITESGWPSQGINHNVAVPSDANQQVAIASLKSSFPGDLFVFSAYNEMWKKNTDQTFQAEQYWGVLGQSSN